MRTIALAAVAAFATGPLVTLPTPAAAQFYPAPVPLCQTPWGLAPCGPPMPRPMPIPPSPSYTFQMPGPQPFTPQPGTFGGGGPQIPVSWQQAARQAGVTADTVLLAEIGQTCGPNPKCWAASWAAIEFSRCANGFGNRGGCFGPNGEVRKIVEGTFRDITQGPGRNHDIVGKDGWVCRTLFGGC